MYRNSNFEDLDILYKPLEIKKTVLSQREALFDLKLCLYLLQNACISFYEQNNKYKVSKKYHQIKMIIKNKETISVLDFFELLKQLTEEIKDGHSYFFRKNDDSMIYENFTQKKSVFFSEIYFEKNCESFVSAEKKIRIHGDILTSDSKIKIKEDKVYFVPIIKNKTVLYKAVIFKKNEKDTAIEKLIQNQIIIFKRYIIYGESFIKNLQRYTTDLIDYWTFPDCTTEENRAKSHYEYLIELAKKRKDTVIIDNRLNKGGIPFRTLEVLFELFGCNKEMLYSYKRDVSKTEDELEGSILISGLTAQKYYQELIDAKSEDTMNTIREFWKDQITKYNKGKKRIHHESKKNNPPWIYNKSFSKNIKYSGLIVIIISEMSYSFGELLYDFIKKQLGYENIVLVGTNSGGAVTYGNPKTFFLKNSPIGLVLSSATDGDSKQTKYYKKYIENRGFFRTFGFQMKKI